MVISKDKCQWWKDIPILIYVPVEWSQNSTDSQGVTLSLFLNSIPETILNISFCELLNYYLMWNSYDQGGGAVSTRDWFRLFVLLDLISSIIVLYVKIINTILMFCIVLQNSFGAVTKDKLVRRTGTLQSPRNSSLRTLS